MSQEVPVKLSRSSEQTQDVAQLPLPPEVIELIFQHLSVFQLQQVRLTCHLWKTVVDSSSVLLRKFCLNLSRDAILDQTSEPTCLLPVPHVSIGNARIISLEPWWGVLGGKLTRISIFKSKFSLEMLAGVLRRTPNLKELDLFCNRYPANVDISQIANFQLDRLVWLKIHDHYDKLFQMLRRICTQLQHLDCDTDDKEQQLIEYLQTAQRTLKSICISVTDSILTTMTSLPSLRLERVIFSHGLTTNENLLKFVQAKPTIQTLSIGNVELSNAVWFEIGKNLPNLRHLRIELCSTNLSDSTIWRPTFLSNMPHLEQLSINAECACTTFKTYCSPNLKELDLCGLHFESSEGLGRYLQHSPNLQKLTLQNTSIVAESDLLENLPLTKLHTLRLISVKCSEKDECLVVKLENLRILELSNADVSENLMSALIQLSPRLESVRICEMPFDDKLVLEMCRSLKWLKILSLQRCPITDASVDQIITNCHVLEQLDVSSCSKVSEEAKRRLVATGRYQIKDILD